MRVLVLTIGLVGSCLAAAACTSSSHGTGTGTANDVTSFGMQYCALFTPCCADAGLSTTGATCETFVQLAASQGAYDPTAGNACLSALEQAQSNADFCTTFGSNAAATAACNKVFTKPGGSVPPGGPCTKDGDCAPSADGSKVTCFDQFTFGDGGSVDTRTCMVQPVSTTAGDMPCVGTVDGNLTIFDWGNAPVPSTGYVCSAQAGLFCDQTTHICTALKMVGASCTGDSDCVATAYCDFSMGMSVCAARVAVGAPCTQAQQCVKTAGCDTGTMTCAELLPAGAACTGGQQCQSGGCVNGKCDSSGGSLGLSFICGS